MQLLGEFVVHLIVKNAFPSQADATHDPSDLYDYLKTTLTTAQLKNISDGYKALIKDLGDEGANDVLRRTKMVVAYGVSPAIDMVHANGETPDMAYMAMSKQLTPDFVKSVVVLVKDTLTPTEWNNKSKDDVEKTQDGKESEAERIVNANKDIKIAAKSCFDKLEQLLEKSTAEVENMDV
ncbi:unnamed protein product [Angiostrongylus costaricensis]|uniref:TIP120 domain-containing protein n=1 Tax=Angiostrongylus costaricensis TaxID=334426 RepID=A0A158PG51_ANGCS|nr:unnamed protein product [Angiostrongylus costaricensis]